MDKEGLCVCNRTVAAWRMKACAWDEGLRVRRRCVCVCGEMKVA